VEIEARAFRPDVIHAHSPVLVGLPALRVGRRLGIPVVYEIRDLWENASVDRGRFAAGSLLYRVARGLEGYVLRRADAVVTICELLRSELAPRAGRPDKVHVVANGVDVLGFTPQAPDEALRQRLGLTGKELILYAGTFQRYEGLDLLVRAIAEIARQRPQAHLVIVGGSAGFAGGAGPVSPEEQELRAAASEAGAVNHVTFTGRIPHAEVKGLYALADILSYPRRLTLTTALTTPLKPLEGMAMAKAVVASDVPPMKELVQDGSTGLLFRAGDHLDLARKCLDLLSDPRLRTRLGETAREWVVRERQWPALVAGYRKVYESIRAPGSVDRIPA
jgi:PEP-CTERM/exosortase A-associated glycosyltransferase